MIINSCTIDPSQGSGDNATNASRFYNSLWGRIFSYVKLLLFRGYENKLENHSSRLAACITHARKHAPTQFLFKPFLFYQLINSERSFTSSVCYYVIGTRTRASFFFFVRDGKVCGIIPV